MALAEGEIRSGGQVFDTEGRRVLLAVEAGSELDPTHVRSGGRVFDPDGREVVVIVEEEL